jgi:hypothetical protein
MNSIFRKISFSDVAIAAGLLALGALLWAQNSKNPIEVALLRWYPANATAGFSACGGNSLGNLAFDGRHLWATCIGTGSVEEYNASDGAKVATVTQLFPSGSPYAGLHLSNILYDGKNIWVSGNGMPTIGAVAKVSVAAVNSNASSTMTCASLTAANCTQITTGVGAFGLAFDGASVWVANSTSSNFTKVASDGTATTFTPTTTCLDPIALAFDTTYMWATCGESNSVQAFRVYGGTQQQVFTTGVVSSPVGLLYDGTYIWVGSTTGTFNLISSSGPGTFTVNPSFSKGSSSSGMSYDGKYVWLADYSNAQVLKVVPPATGSGIPTVNYTITGLSGPESPAFDGGNVWVANSGANTLLKF